jgi:hypothetical protein
MQIINVPAIISVKQIIVRAEEMAGRGEAVPVATDFAPRATLISAANPRAALASATGFAPGATLTPATSLHDRI